MSKNTTAVRTKSLEKRLAVYVLAAAVSLLAALALYGCEENSPALPTPAPSPTVANSVAIPSEISSDSTPSASWPDLLAAAQAKVTSVYTDAILSSVSASPYDYTLNAYYQPKSDILRVGFSFITPAVEIIRVEVADDAPAKTVQMSSNDHTDDSFFKEIYTDTVKVEPTIVEAVATIKITPRQAVQLTQKEAIDHANQIGLGAETLIPGVKLDTQNAASSTWEVSYGLNPISQNGNLTPKEPVVTFAVDIRNGAILSRTYQDAADPLAATPGLTSTMQAMATQLVATYMPTVSAMETQGPPSTAQQYYDQGKRAELSRNTDQAIEYYDKAIVADPNFADAYMARALIYQGRSDYEQAIIDCTKVIEIAPRYEAYITRGNAYVRLGDEDSSKSQPDLALKDFDAAIQLEPDKAEAYAFRGLAYYSQDDYDAAVIAYTEAIEHDNQYEEAYFARGLSYQAKEEYDQAISDYDQYIKLDPHKSWAFRQRAEAYVYKGDPAQAIPDYTEAIRLQPDYSDAYYGRGNAYLRLSDYDHAMQDYDKVIELDPKYLLAYEGRGVVYYSIGEYTQAISEFTIALTIYPQVARIYEQRGRAYLRSDKVQQSMTDFNKAIGLDPDMALTYVSRGRAYITMSDYGSALADFNTALQKDADYAWAYENRAIAYAYKGDFTEAFADIDQAIKISGADDYSYFARGKVYALQGDKDKALEDFDKYGQLAKDYNSQQDLTKELQALQNK
ncbi:MAG TPA: tetratricopeptide repeat protein [Chloroflexia bacterium]|nr:tetratricopeptide repeat protein [Chloroflexia bacterium]